jgi:hypothetical protein
MRSLTHLPLSLRFPSSLFFGFSPGVVAVSGFPDTILKSLTVEVFEAMMAVDVPRHLV